MDTGSVCCDLENSMLELENPNQGLIQVLVAEVDAQAEGQACTCSRSHLAALALSWER